MAEVLSFAVTVVGVLAFDANPRAWPPVVVVVAGIAGLVAMSVVG